MYMYLFDNDIIVIVLVRSQFTNFESFHHLYKSVCCKTLKLVYRLLMRMLFQTSIMLL